MKTISFDIFFSFCVSANNPIALKFSQILSFFQRQYDFVAIFAKNGLDTELCPLS